MLEANGLKLHTIKSKAAVPERLAVNSLDDIKEYIIKKYINANSLVVAYLDYTVLVGRYKSNNFEFYKDHTLEPAYIQRLRIFNQAEELLLWRAGSGFRGRYRKDGDGDEAAVVDAMQVLFGTSCEPVGNDYTRLSEQRGTEIILPFKELSVNTAKNRVFVMTRNYIGYNGAYQATYEDCRFTGFYHDDKELN